MSGNRAPLIPRFLFIHSDFTRCSMPTSGEHFEARLGVLPRDGDCEDSGRANLGRRRAPRRVAHTILAPDAAGQTRTAPRRARHSDPEQHHAARAAGLARAKYFRLAQLAARRHKFMRPMRRAKKNPRPAIGEPGTTAPPPWHP